MTSQSQQSHINRQRKHIEAIMNFTANPTPQNAQAVNDTTERKDKKS